MLRNSMIRNVFVFISFVVFYIIFFAPVLFGNGSFIIHDNTKEFFPAFLTNPVLWESKIGLGYPVFADPQQQVFYPLQYIFPKSIDGFNFYVIHFFILGSFFAYLFAYELTGAILVSVLAGVLYGLSGSMLGQLSMLTVVSVSSFLPGILYSYYLLMKKPKTFVPLLFASVFTALGFLAGHPQFFAHIMLMTGILVLFHLYDHGIRTERILAATFALGVGLFLAGIQLFPFAELLQFTQRSGAIDYESFSMYQMRMDQLIRLIYPYYYGGSQSSYLIKEVYNLVPSYHELYRYMGILPLFLWLPGLIYLKDKKLKLFFGFALIFYLLYSFGNETPFGWIIYKMPVLNRFRGPARHFLEITFILSILTSVALKSIFSEKLSRYVSVYWMALVILAAGAPLLYYLLGVHGAPEITRFHWLSIGGNNLILFQITAIGAIFFVLIIGTMGRSRNSMIPLLILLTVVELSVNQYQNIWRIQSAFSNKEKIYHSDLLRVLDGLGIHGDFRVQAHSPLHSFDKRMNDLYALSGEPLEIFEPNFNIVNHVSVSNLYTPLFLKNWSILALIGSGNTHREKAGYYNIKYNVGLYRSQRLISNSEYLLGNCGMNEVISMFLAGTPPHERIIPDELKGKNLEIYAGILCISGNVKDGDKIFSAELTSANGQVVKKDIKYNSDIGLEKVDCTTARSMKNVYAVKESEKGCGAIYKISIPLPDKYIPARIRFVDYNKALTLINGISSDSPEKKYFYNVNYFPYANHDEIISRKYEDLMSFEFKNAFPRIYPVGCVSSTKEDIIRSAIFSGKFIDPTFMLLGGNVKSSKSYDIRQRALVSDRGEQPDQGFLRKECNKSVGNDVLFQNIKHYNGGLEFEYSAKNDVFLVINEIYYPGWRATINGKDANVYLTNSMVQGIELFQGKGKVRLYFYSESLFYGSIATLISILILIIYYLYLNKKSDLLGNEE